MRLLPFSLGVCGWGLALIASAQSPSGGGSMPQIPFGQTYKDFEFPLYQNGQLSYTLSAVSATGITVNRAQTNDLKIQVYTDGKVTTTITSPNADLYIAERKMRTRNTVKIERADVDATAQICDFDLITKKYLLQQNVHVVLKHFDAGAGLKKASHPAPSSASATPIPSNIASPGAEPSLPMSSPAGESPLDTPGAVGSTNGAPLNPGPAHP